MPAGTALASVLESAGSLSQRLDERLGIRPTFFASSGRAALTILLKALQQRSDRREVVIPRTPASRFRRRWPAPGS
jgi:hypothetical protein